MSKSVWLLVGGVLWVKFLILLCSFLVNLFKGRVWCLWVNLMSFFLLYCFFLGFFVFDRLLV